MYVNISYTGRHGALYSAVEPNKSEVSVDRTIFFSLGNQDIEQNRPARYKTFFMPNTVRTFRICITWPTLCSLTTTPWLNLPRYNHAFSNLAKFTMKHLRGYGF